MIQRKELSQKEKFAFEQKLVTEQNKCFKFALELSSGCYRKTQHVNKYK